MRHALTAGVCLGFLALAPTAHATGGKGLTWARISHASGIDEVGCDGCNPYDGDTACTERRPILCIKYDTSPRPANLSHLYYAGWAGGNIATTLPVAGTLLESLPRATQLCIQFFGPGWRMATFHDGAGWGFNAYGAVRSDTRFWVYINDQQANCWNP
ncbi:flagellar hook-length control protein [Myxococcus sp. K38C18041901]|uniref:flagellar hook-length control protein n=1 Tax=Myxococcus guangdongensis TaxID=2906760 RepID=UPI0020A7CBE0|nr:flagellar hook-length control protein [Myxococcus guangdongensis]MCP3062901.1 flagellar hook-length control protein [Myxococcus guangdongensis]